MKYNPYFYAVNPYVENKVNEILVDSFDVLSCSIVTRMYLCTKIIGEIDRLTKMVQILPVTVQTTVRDSIDKLNSAVKKLSEDVPVSQQFSNVELPKDKVELLKSHPYVKLLNVYKSKGFNLDRAIDLVADQVGTTEGALTKFVKNNNIKYGFDTVAKDAYVAGVESAKVKSTIDNMYESAEKYRLTDPLKFNSFVMGFSSVANFSKATLDEEFIKYKIIQYSNTLDTSILSDIINH